VDGICGKLTITAIHQFQLISFGRGDGRVDPGGPTLAALNAYAAGQGVISPIQNAFADYDFRGTSYVVPISTTYVATRTKKNPFLGSGASGVSEDLFSWFVGKLNALDKALEGSAKQSWGVVIYGGGTGKDSPATQLSKDGTTWGSFDYAKFMAIMDLVLAAIPEGTDYHDTLKNMRDALKSKQPEKAATFIQESVVKIEEIQGISNTHRSLTPRSTTPAKVTVSKVEVGQWVWMDPSGNEYVKIKYSDGSTRFVFGSIYGVYDIPDPGAVDWQRVP
jgi:hypothetical protein